MRKYKHLQRLEGAPILARVSGGTVAITNKHSADEHCDVDDSTDYCRTCGVHHGDACPTCGGRGFHRDFCAASAGATRAAIVARVVDEISSLELLRDMAADLEQTGRVAYCNRRIKKLRAHLASTPTVGGAA